MNGEAAIPDGAGAAALALITIAIRDHGVAPGDWDEACGAIDPQGVALVMATITAAMFERACEELGKDGAAEWAGYCARLTGAADTEGLRHFL